MGRNIMKHVPLFAVLIVLISAWPAHPEMLSGRIEIGTRNVSVTVAFGERDERRIREYYGRKRHEHRGDRAYADDRHRGDEGRKQRKNMKTPPGLARKDRLPPGLERKLRKNAPLPPGLRGRLLPHDLERALHPLPEPYVRVKMERDVLIMDRETSMVVDILHDVDGPFPDFP